MFNVGLDFKKISQNRSYIDEQHNEGFFLSFFLSSFLINSFFRLECMPDATQAKGGEWRVPSLNKISFASFFILFVMKLNWLEIYLMFMLHFLSEWPFSSSISFPIELVCCNFVREDSIIIELKFAKHNNLQCF